MVYTTEQLQYYTSIIRTLPEEQRQEARAYIKQLDDPAAADAYLMELTKTAGATESKRKASNTANKSAGSKARKAPGASKAVKPANKTTSSQNKDDRTTGTANIDRLERVNGETVEKSDFDIDDIKENIQALINTFCSTYDIEDLTKAPQRQFTALSIFIGNNLFKNTKLLKNHEPMDNGSAVVFRNRDYDFNKVGECIELYYSLCMLYNKAFLFDGVAGFLHMAENTLHNNHDKLTSIGIDLFQKREATLSAGAVDARAGNVTGLLAGLNHWHNWTTAAAPRQERVESIQVLPVLVDINEKSGKVAIIDKQESQ